jgi:hypothetical protein
MIFFASDSAAPFRVVCHVSVTQVVDTARKQDRRSSLSLDDLNASTS